MRKLPLPPSKVPPVSSGLPLPPVSSANLPLPPVSSANLPLPPVSSGLPIPPVSSGLPLPPVSSGLPLPPASSPGLPLPPASSPGLPLPRAKVPTKVLPLPPVSPRLSLPPSILALPVPLPLPVPVPVVPEEDPEENVGWNLYYSPEAPTIFSYYVSKKRKDPSHIPMAFNIDIPEGAPNLYVYGIIEKKSRKLISDFFYTIKEAKDYLEYNEYGKGYRAEKFSKKIFFPVYRK